MNETRTTIREWTTINSTKEKVHGDQGEVGGRRGKNDAH